MRSFIANNNINIQGDELNYRTDDHNRNLHHEDMNLPPENTNQDKGTWKDDQRQNKFVVPQQTEELRPGPFPFEINNTMTYPSNGNTYQAQPNPIQIHNLNPMYANQPYSAPPNFYHQMTHGNYNMGTFVPPQVAPKHPATAAVLSSQKRRNSTSDIPTAFVNAYQTNDNGNYPVPPMAHYSNTVQPDALFRGGAPANGDIVNPINYQVAQVMNQGIRRNSYSGEQPSSLTVNTIHVNGSASGGNNNNNNNASGSKPKNVYKSKESEYKRRTRINERLQDLKCLIPEFTDHPEKSATKEEILTETIRYIQELEGQCSQLSTAINKRQKGDDEASSSPNISGNHMNGNYGNMNGGEDSEGSPESSNSPMSPTQNSPFSGKN